MLRLLIKLFLSSGLLLGAFTVTGKLPIQKKENRILVSDVTETNEKKEIKTLEDIAIFERKNNCSFSFVHRWDSKDVYSINQFLEKNKANKEKEKYTDKAIKKSNDSKDNCKKNGLVIFFYQGNDFNLKGNVSSGEFINK